MKQMAASGARRRHRQATPLKTKTPGASAGCEISPQGLIGRSLDDRKVARRLLAALGDDVERHLLPFVERAKARFLDRADMNEHVLAAVSRRDEAVSLLR